MKNLVIGACLVASGFAGTASAEAKDYVARLNDNGLYCARVETVGINGLPQRKTRCRTLEGWKKAGYLVGQKEVSEVE